MDNAIAVAIIGFAGTIAAAVIGLAANRAKSLAIDQRDRVIRELRQRVTQQDTIRGGEDMTIVSGSFQAGKNHPAGWQLLEGQGERPFESRIDFPKPFKTPPAVVVALSGLDVLSKTNCRATVKARAIDRNGFTVCFKTWSDTRVYGLWVQWFAYGD